MILVWLVACDAEKPGDSADESWGAVIADRAGETATVSVEAAFGFNSASNGKALLYLTPNPEVTCHDMSTVLRGPEDDEWNPATITPSGSCSLFLYGDYPAQTSWDVEPGTPSATMLVVLNCAMGDGEWVESGDCEGGYCYSGHYWQGSPQRFSATLGGGDGEPLTLALEMDDYTGGFTYELMEDAPASGRVQGSAEAGWCDDFAESPYF